MVKKSKLMRVIILIFLSFFQTGCKNERAGTNFMNTKESVLENEKNNPAINDLKDKNNPIGYNINE